MNKDFELLTRKEASEYLKVSLPTLDRWTKAGLIPSYLLGTRVRYKRAELFNSLVKVEVVSA